MKQKHITTVAFSLCLLAAPVISHAQVPGLPAAPGGDPAVAPEAETLQSFNFLSADLDTVLAMYSEWTGKIPLRNDGLNASITINASGKMLTTAECIDAVETILLMNNIALVPYGENFVKVVPATEAPGRGGIVNYDDQPSSDKDRIVHQIIKAENVAISQVQSSVQYLMSPFGQIHVLEGNNSMLITDTEANIERIRELIDYIDQAAEKVVPRFYTIKYAEAATIASTLQQIITMAQADQQNNNNNNNNRNNRNIRTPQGVVRPGGNGQAAITTMAGPGTSVMIQGNVQVTSDERTNMLIIFSQESNFTFFEELIEMLDIEVDPDVTYEVVRLEYADATEISSTLNELLGSTQNNNNNNANQQFRAFQQQQGMNPNDNQSLNKLSENTTILADDRSNSILLTGGKADIATIKTVISDLDVMLEQVMIEAAIFEIGLTDDLEHGIQWLYKNQNNTRQGAWNVGGLATNSLQNVASGALNYYQNLTGINTELAVQLAKTDNNAKLLATPVIMTTDNTEASLSIGESRPVMTGNNYNTYGSSSQYSYRDIGIQLTVTPHINPQRFVVMEISQQADQLGGTTTIDGNPVPIILNRSFDASLAVPDRGTVALGGLITTETTKSETKVPILGDIPLLGRFLFSSVHDSEVQRELVVLMTPYVMTNDAELKGETERIYQKTSIQPEDWDANWSESQLRY